MRVIDGGAVTRRERRLRRCAVDVERRTRCEIHAIPVQRDEVAAGGNGKCSALAAADREAHDDAWLEPVDVGRVDEEVEGGWCVLYGKLGRRRTGVGAHERAAARGPV